MKLGLTKRPQIHIINLLISPLDNFTGFNDYLINEYDI
jgi:hypothetical protein